MRIAVRRAGRQLQSGPALKRNARDTSPLRAARNMVAMCTPTPTSDRLLGGATRSVAAAVTEALAPFGEAALSYAAARGIRIVPLSRTERYAQASPSLRRLGVDVDAWPVPPAGLFVVEERTVYLRSATPMTVAHEFGHALDCALGGGVYRSSYDSVVRRAFARARRYVTPYAATGLDEYFAESMRAFVEVNDAISPWPEATRASLHRADPAMFEFMQELFERDFNETMPTDRPNGTGPT